MRGKAAVKKNISGSKTISKMFSKPRGTYEVVLTLAMTMPATLSLCSLTQRART